MSKDIIVIYHASCMDGFTAAYAAWKLLNDAAEYIPAQYGDAPPDVTGKDVFILDFSYKQTVMREMASKAHSVTILDHHKTAQAEIQPLLDEGIVHGVFDMHSSGAMLAWNWFHVFEEAPDLIKHAQDYDLWRFELPDTRAIVAALYSYEKDFRLWDEFVNEWDKPEEGLISARLKLLSDGEAILRQQERHVEAICRNAGTRLIGGYTVPCVNAPGFLASAVGNKLCQGVSFAASYFIDADGTGIFSLRSDENGIDVSEIAREYCGGGHQHAAGFKILSMI